MKALATPAFLVVLLLSSVGTSAQEVEIDRPGPPRLDGLEVDACVYVTPRLLNCAKLDCGSDFKKLARSSACKPSILMSSTRSTFFGGGAAETLSPVNVTAAHKVTMGKIILGSDVRKCARGIVTHNASVFFGVASVRFTLSALIDVRVIE